MANFRIKNTAIMLKKILNHKARKEHKVFFVLLNPKPKILNPHLLIYFSNFDISFNNRTDLHQKKIKYTNS